MLEPRGNELMTSRVKTEFQQPSVASPRRALAGERCLANEAAPDAWKLLKRRIWPKNSKTVPDAVLPYTRGILSSF